MYSPWVSFLSVGLVGIVKVDDVTGRQERRIVAGDEVPQ